MVLDPSAFSLSGDGGLGALDPSLFNLSGTDLGGFDLTGTGGSGGLLFDTLTGQFVTPQQAQLLDPSFTGSPFGQGIESTYTPGGSMPAPGNGAGTSPSGGGGFNFGDAMRMGAQGLGLATAGLGAAGIGQGLLGGAQPGASQTGTINQTRTSMPGPMSPELQAIFSQLGGPGYGGLQGMAGHGITQNMAPQGLMNQQQNALNYAAGSLPAPDALLNQNLIANAQGMATGNLPALSPQLQGQINNIYGSQWNNINRYLEDYLVNVRDQMNNQGWEGGTYDVLRQGPGQAMFAPGIREATRQQGLLAGQAAQAGINLAQQLPMNALQLGGGVLQQGLAANQGALNLANAFNQPIQTRNQVPLTMFQGLNQNRGDVSTMTQNANTQNMQPPMSLWDAFNNATKVVGGLGGLAGGVQPTVAPQQQPVMGQGTNGAAGMPGGSYTAMPLNPFAPGAGGGSVPTQYLPGPDGMRLL